MADTTYNTTRRNIITGMVAAAALCVPLPADATAGVSPASIVQLAREAAKCRDRMLRTGFAYQELQLEGRLLAYREATLQYEAAVEDLLFAAEDVQ